MITLNSSSISLCASSTLILGSLVNVIEIAHLLSRTKKLHSRWVIPILILICANTGISFLNDLAQILWNFKLDHVPTECHENTNRSFFTSNLDGIYWSCLIQKACNKSLTALTKHTSKFQGNYYPSQFLIAFIKFVHCLSVKAQPNSSDFPNSFLLLLNSCSIIF